MKTPELMVTQGDGVPLPDQAHAIEEFKRRCEGRSWLDDETFQVEHNPNCPSPYKVRLVQYGRGRIHGDKDDAIGFGKTLYEAADKARILRDAVKALAIAKRAGVTVPTTPTVGAPQS
jgi:hypothetical protein